MNEEYRMWVCVCNCFPFWLLNKLMASCYTTYARVCQLPISRISCILICHAQCWTHMIITHYSRACDVRFIVTDNSSIALAVFVQLSSVWRKPVCNMMVECQLVYPPSVETDVRRWPFEVIRLGDVWCAGRLTCPALSPHLYKSVYLLPCCGRFVYEIGTAVGSFSSGFRMHIPFTVLMITLTYLLIFLLTYAMVQSPSWEANWFAARQEIPRISRNPNVHYHTHKLPPTVPILSQPNQVHIQTSHLLEIHPNIICPSTPRSPQWSLSLRFPQQDPIQPPVLTHKRDMASPSHSSRFYHPQNIGWGVQII